MGFILSVIFSILPEAYRPAWVARRPGVDFRVGALVGGLLQMLIFVGLLINGYFPFMNDLLGVTTEGALEAGRQQGLGMHQAGMGLGVLGLGSYLLEPRSLLFIYLAVEGLVRWVAALITHEAVASLPLALVAMLQSQAGAKGKEVAMGKRIPDLVEQRAGDEIALVVRSCRPKPNWDQMMTISYGDQLYELAKAEPGVKPRPFVYRLRRAPAHKVVRGLHHYDPEEVVRQD